MIFRCWHCRRWHRCRHRLSLCICFYLNAFAISRCSLERLQHGACADALSFEVRMGRWDKCLYRTISTIQPLCAIWPSLKSPCTEHRAERTNGRTEKCNGMKEIAKRQAKWIFFRWKHCQMIHCESESTTKIGLRQHGNPISHKAHTKTALQHSI